MRLIWRQATSAVFFGLLVTALLLTSGCEQRQQQVRLKLAHTLDQAHVVHLAMEYMAERLAHYSDNTMAIDIYPSGQLGNERELVELLQIGSLGMTKVSASPMEGFVPEMKIFSIPYLFRDREHYWNTLNSPLGKSLLLKPEKVGLRGLGYYDAGSRSFYTSFGQVNHPSNLDGQKIRVMNSQTAIGMVNSLGGAATPISWGELYTALQQGVVDGAENNPPTFYLSKHYEVCKYYSLDEHSSVPDLLLISRHVWGNLTVQQQQWLQAAVDDSVVYQKQLWTKATEEALLGIAEAGVEIIRPDKAPFQAAVEEFYESFDGSPVGEMIKKIRNIQ